MEQDAANRFTAQIDPVRDAVWSWSRARGGSSTLSQRVSRASPGLDGCFPIPMLNELLQRDPLLL
eukprot:1911077-Lingulodinium_polyedra.AAC.1